MKCYAVVLFLSAGVLCTVIGFAQSTKETSESHVAAAGAAARQEHTGCREAGTYGTLRFNTSDGIIIIDAIFDYSVEDEIVKRIAEAGLGSKENLNTSS